MLTPLIRGLKFPDEAVIRFFFKERLNNFKGSVLELGCGNGNNLKLFYEYGYDVTGLDLIASQINDAELNFKALKTENNLLNNYEFIQDNMLNFFEKSFIGLNNIILFPSSLFYLEYQDIIRVLELIKKNVKPRTYLFFKLLTDMDYRFQNSNKIPVSKYSYRINFKETAEHGQIITFLSCKEWQDLLKNFFTFEHLNALNLNFENIQEGIITNNSNIIIYGKLKDEY